MIAHLPILRYTPRMLRLLIAIIALSSLALGVSLGADGNIKATMTLHPDGTRTSTVVDPMQGTAEEKTEDSSGKMIRKVTYLLDDRSQPMAAITYNAKGVEMYRSAYKRDASGRIDEENVTAPTGQLLRRRVYTYGGNNKIVNVDEFDGQGRLIPKPPKSTGPGRPDKKKR